MNLVKTQGIKYIGSKEKIIPYILFLVGKVNPQVVLDGFSGTTRVSQALAKSGYCVYSNDIAIWSKVFEQCYLLNQKPADYYQKIIDYLNNLSGKYGWFTEHYGGRPDDNKCKRPWQIHNTMKLDAIREEIDKVVSDEIEKSVLLTSLILALDKVDNTLGHYASYLKGWSKRSYNTLKLEVPDFVISNKEHKVYQKDIFELLPVIKEVDLAYFDPPYGSNNDKMPPSRVRYQAYYHIWTTIIKNDKPQLFGSANRRFDSSDKISYSPFEDFRKNKEGQFVVMETIKKLIEMTPAKFIIFSYSSGGRLPFEILADLFSKHTDIVEVLKINHKENVMGSMRWTNEWIKEIKNPHQEYLFLLKKK